MSQQAHYITNLERALEGLLECFDVVGGKLHIEVGEGLVVVGPELQDVYDYALQIMYGDEALMEDEI